MEPTTAPTKPKPLAKPGDKGVEQEEGKVQKGKGKLGSLNNPETYENVPGHVIPILEHEFEDFESEADQFLDGQTPENEFIGFRLKQGVYGPVSYTHLRAHETVLDLVCRLLLEKKKL